MTIKNKGEKIKNIRCNITEKSVCQINRRKNKKNLYTVRMKIAIVHEMLIKL